MLPKTLFFSLLLVLWVSPAMADVNESGEAARSACFNQSPQQGVLDQAYDYLNIKFCEPAIWFDDFFVDERSSQDARAGTMVRWSNDFSLVEHQGGTYKTRLKARVHLPQVTRKLKLVFESDSEDHLEDLFPTTTEETRSALGLRYDALVASRSSLNFKASLRPSIEARYRYTYPFSEQSIWRFTQRLYQKRKTTGSVTQLDLDTKVSPQLVFRWNNFIKLESDVDGAEVGSGISLYQFISDRRALSYSVSISGKNEPFHYVTNTHISIKYRQNIFRKWLFYELTPELNWPKEEDKQRMREAIFTLRLEVLFNNV